MVRAVVHFLGTHALVVGAKIMREHKNAHTQCTRRASTTTSPPPTPQNVVDLRRMLIAPTADVCALVCVAVIIRDRKMWLNNATTIYRPGSSLNSFVSPHYRVLRISLTCQQASVVCGLAARKHRLHENTHLTLGRVASAHNAETQRLAAGSLVKVHRQVDAFLQACGLNELLL